MLQEVGEMWQTTSVVVWFIPDTYTETFCVYYRRDDEHRTGLMSAATEGHIPVIKLLLDNHAAVNDGDKMKVTAFSYSTEHYT